MKKLLFLLLLIPFLGTSQGTFTAPVGYNTGAPTAAPSGVGTRWRFDLLTGKKYTWNPDAVAWDEDARGIDQVSGCSAPLYTPGYNQSTFSVNSCTPPELYQWTGSAWAILNPETLYTEGTGISISGGNVISNTGDLSATNELNTSLSVLGSNLQIVDPGGTLTVPVSDIAPVQEVAAGTGISISGTTTRTISSTITQGLTSLNSQTGTTQTFATGTTGTDFGILSAANTHTFNLPSASATNRGALTSADWSVFNGKIGGSGTTNYLPKFSSASAIGNSLIYDTGANLGINTTTPDKLLTFKSTSLPLKGFSLDENGMYLSRQTDGVYVSSISLDATSSISDLYWQIETARTVWRRGGGSMAWMAAGSFVNPTIDGYFSVNNILSKYIQSWGNEGVIYSADQNNNVANVGHKVIQGTRPGASTAGIMGWFYDTTERARLTTAGDFGINTTTPTSKTDINGANGYSQLRLRTTYTPTSTADALGNTGDTAWDANYFYIKTSAGWKRAALSTF